MSGTCACSETATGLMVEASLEGGLFPPPPFQPEFGDSEKSNKERNRLNIMAEVIIMNAAKKFYDDAEK